MHITLPLASVLLFLITLMLLVGIQAVANFLYARYLGRTERPAGTGAVVSGRPA